MPTTDQSSVTSTPFGRAMDRLSSTFNLCGTLLIAALMIFVNADVMGRAAFNAPITGVPEFAALSIVGIVFFQITNCLRNNQFTRSESLLVKLQRGFPRAAMLIDATYHVVGAALFMIIGWAVSGHALNAYRIGDYAGVAGLVTFPTWPIKAVVVLGSVLAALQFSRMALIRFHASRNAAAARAFSISGGIQV